MNRHCGSCTLCCTLLPIAEIGKPANKKCAHQSSKGCGVYNKLGMPASCRAWSCLWLIDDKASELYRPDRAGYVIDQLPDLIRAINNETGAASELLTLQVWCDPHRPEAWQDPALRRYAATLGAGAILVRFSETEALGMVATADGWSVASTSVSTHTMTGSRLLDRLKREARHDQRPGEAIAGGRLRHPDELPPDRGGDRPAAGGDAGVCGRGDQRGAAGRAGEAPGVV